MKLLLIWKQESGSLHIFEKYMK